MSEELVDFTNHLRSLLKQTNKVTKLTSDSIDALDTVVTQQYSSVYTLFELVELKGQTIKNLNLCLDQLDEFLKLINIIETDKFDIVRGHQGLITVYIQKLDGIRAMEKYVWIKELETSNHIRKKKAEADLKVHYAQYLLLMRQGETILFQEFLSTVKYFSNSDQMESFFDFLINRFVFGENDMVSQDNENNEPPPPSDLSIDLFIPKETIQKLENICAWFLQREEQYELYNENSEHCDINQKLKFGEVRNEFIKTCMATYFKVNSVTKCGSKKKSSSRDKDKDIAKNVQNATLSNLIRISAVNSRENFETGSQVDKFCIYFNL